MPTVKTRMSAFVEKAGGIVSAIPWAMLFDFLMQFLNGCAAKDVKQLAKEHPVYVKGLLRRKLIDEGLSRREAVIQADAAVKTLATASAKEIEDFTG